MTLRTEAGDSVIGMRRATLREPTGSPVARYDSTIWRKISRERSSSCASVTGDEPMGALTDTALSSRSDDCAVYADMAAAEQAASAGLAASIGPFYGA